MDLNLQGKTALILGGSRGLGRGVADALAAEGVSPVLVARDRHVLDNAVSEIAARHSRPVFGICADLSKVANADNVVNEAQGLLGGPIDILLNNSGGPPATRAIGIDMALWQTQFEAMVLSLMRVTDRVLPTMRARRWGRIITIASSSVVEPIPMLAISNALRGALAGWSKTLAGEVARDGVTVNLLLPGQISTARTEQLDALAAEREGVDIADIAKRHAAAIPVGRYGTPQEFGAVAAFIASEQASYVTGAMIRIDGGAAHSL